MPSSYKSSTSITFAELKFPTILQCTYSLNYYKMKEKICIYTFCLRMIQFISKKKVSMCQSLRQSRLCFFFNEYYSIRFSSLAVFTHLPKGSRLPSQLLKFATFIYIHLPFMMASTSNDVPFDNMHTHECEYYKMVQCAFSVKIHRVYHHRMVCATARFMDSHFSGWNEKRIV